MGRFLGPVGKVSRHLGVGVSPKGDRILERRPYKPGQHGRAEGRQKQTSQYGLQLMEKQKARFTYGLLEKQFRNLFTKAQSRPGITGSTLLSLLESRLDNVVYRLNFARSRAQARQLVSHGHITVNGKKLNIASARVVPGDIVAVCEKSKGCAYFKQLAPWLLLHPVPDWLSLKAGEMTAVVLAIPGPEHAEPYINTQSIVEFYSR